MAENSLRPGCQAAGLCPCPELHCFPAARCPRLSHPRSSVCFSVPLLHWEQVTWTTQEDFGGVYSPLPVSFQSPESLLLQRAPQKPQRACTGSWLGGHVCGCLGNGDRGRKLRLRCNDTQPLHLSLSPPPQPHYTFMLKCHSLPFCAWLWL